MILLLKKIPNKYKWKKISLGTRHLTEKEVKAFPFKAKENPRRRLSHVHR
jgi:hypothetical protein